MSGLSILDWVAFWWGTGFFINLCVDIYEKIDLRVRNFNVPTQEIKKLMAITITHCFFVVDPTQR
jgi:hypothetical protein